MDKRLARVLFVAGMGAGVSAGVAMASALLSVRVAFAPSLGLLLVLLTALATVAVLAWLFWLWGDGSGTTLAPASAGDQQQPAVRRASGASQRAAPPPQPAAPVQAARSELLDTWVSLGPGEADGWDQTLEWDFDNAPTLPSRF
jgi:hypothetical protein